MKTNIIAIAIRRGHILGEKWKAFSPIKPLSPVLHPDYDDAYPIL